jgi:hypothetical protein
MNREPKIVVIKGGYAAVTEFWAVFGKTKEEAIQKFRETELKHSEIGKRELSFNSDSQPVLANRN